MDILGKFAVVKTIRGYATMFSMIGLCIAVNLGSIPREPVAAGRDLLWLLIAVIGRGALCVAAYLFLVGCMKAFFDKSSVQFIAHYCFPIVGLCCIAAGSYMFIMQEQIAVPHRNFWSAFCIMWGFHMIDIFSVPDYSGGNKPHSA